MSTTAARPLHAQIRNQYLKQFGVSRGIVTRAMRDLEVNGILQRRRGSGTYVLDGKTKAKGQKQGLHIAMFMPWTAQEQTVGSFHINLHHGISSVCSDHHVSHIPNATGTRGSVSTTAGAGRCC